MSALDPLCEADVAAAPSWTPPADLAAARRAYDAAAAIAGGPLADVEVREDVIAGVPVRRYVSKTARAGVFVYAPGGGWVFGHPGTHDAFTRALALAARIEVVSVGYRRAPEARMPAAVEDVTAVLRDLSHDAIVMVGGDSGGGLLAEEAALRVPEVDSIVLLYPALDPTLASPAYDAGLPPVRAQMQWFWDQYLGPDRPPLGEASPLYRADLPTFIPDHLFIEATHDPLYDEGRAYVEKLESRGNFVTTRTYAGHIHGFARQLGRFPRAADVVNEIALFVEDRRGLH